jgi:hypothetical protein
MHTIQKEPNNQHKEHIDCLPSHNTWQSLPPLKSTLPHLVPFLLRTSIKQSNFFPEEKETHDAGHKTKNECGPDGMTKTYLQGGKK